MEWLPYSLIQVKLAGTEVPFNPGENAGMLKMHIFIDNSVLEVFINDGRSTVTEVVYTGNNKVFVKLRAAKGNVALSSFDSWELAPIW